MADPGTETVAFLFTDIEGSTFQWERHPELMRAALAQHDAILRRVITAAGGQVFQTAGDAFSAAFPDPVAALAAAAAAQRALYAESWPTPQPIRVRMALHAGPAERRPDGYFGPATLNRLARLLPAGHGGQTLLTEAVAAALPDPPAPGVILRDLGTHRLRDLRDPQHIFDLQIAGLPDDFPRLRTSDEYIAIVEPPAEPPLGRESEIAAIRSLLLNPDMRLLTLTGRGGSGKTLLIQAVGATLSEYFPQGVAFVPLDDATTAGEVLAAIAAALDLALPAGEPTAPALRTSLRTRRLLLILDTFDRAAAAGALIRDLLLGAPGLKVVVTSRAVLHLYGDHAFPVPPLPLPPPARVPDPVALAANPAVALFLRRAQAARPGFALSADNAATVATLCARLDGIPLALELAAAQLARHSPADLLAALTPRGDDPLPAAVLDLLADPARPNLRPARQHSLRATLAWSYDLLTPAEQALLVALAAFPGAFSFDDAETAASGTAAGGGDILDRLLALIDASLLSQEDGPDGEPRFFLPPLTRAFASEQRVLNAEV
jgi:predicted ATPase/class 3 adenylate cyclase